MHASDFFQPVEHINVGLSFEGASAPIPVGRLALHNKTLYFEYQPSFLEQKLPLSPLHLPLRTGLFRFEPILFEGLPGVFNDSLPDGWGRLLFDRHARQQGIFPGQITPLDRLAAVGKHGMGALVYEPDQSVQDTPVFASLDELAKHVQAVLRGSAGDVLQALLTLNGSSAGARPKALVGLSHNRELMLHGVHDLSEDFCPWLLKFPNTQDGVDAGAVEYVYALMARDAGLLVPEVHLFAAQKGAGYFATQRFDRNGTQRLHMHTACGLLHSDFRVPVLDYQDLLTLTTSLTQDARDLEKMYRLAVFNVLAHNRDDHAKNFSFLMDEHGQWTVAPAYDLTFSFGPQGEQSTMVMCEGRNPGLEHLAKLGKVAGLSTARVREIVEQTRAALSAWPSLAKQYGVKRQTRQMIAKHLERAVLI